MSYTKMNIKNNVLKNGVHYLTSDYKSRNKSRPTHSGIDMIGQGYACDYIIAVDNGIIETVAKDTSRGNYVIIKHNTGLKSVYYHLKDGSIVVKKGANINKGDKIGYMGSTGHSTGNHLHFGVYDGSVVVDPLPYLNGTKSITKNEEPIPTPTTPTIPSKSIEEVAKDVINGKYGNGQERVEKLKAEGYNYDEVQNKVNELLAPKETPATHFIKKGDTLTKIAKKYNTTIKKLIDLNAKKYPKIKESNGNHIEIGWEIKVK